MGKARPFWRRRCLLNPESCFHNFWDWVTVNLLVFTALITPYEVAFSPNDRTFDFILEGADALFWVNRLVDFLFLVDIFLHFNTMSFYHGVLLDTRWKIARHYVKGWFFIDVMSLMPFDFVGMAVGSGRVSQLRVFRVVRLLRLIKLLRLIRLNAFMERWKASSSFSYRRRTLYIMVIVVLATIHWIACCLGFLGNIQGVPCEGVEALAEAEADGDGCVVTWFSTAIAEVTEQGKEWTPGRAYLLALHTASSVVVHPHTRSPVNETEQLVLVALMMWGGWTWTKVISRSTAVVTSMDRHGIHFHQTMDDLKEYCQDKDVCPELRRRLRTYFNNKQGFSLDDTHKQLCAKMSPCLQSSVAYAAHKAWLLRVPYLAKATRPFVVRISFALQNQCFAQDETWGDLFKLYILRRGLASLGVSKIRVMPVGSVWGEEHLLLTDKKLLSPNSAKALSFVETSSLDRVSFERALGEYPENLLRVRQYYVLIAVTRGVIFQARQEQIKREEAIEKDMSCKGSVGDNNGHVQHHAAQGRRVQHIEFNSGGDYFLPTVSAPPATMTAVRREEGQAALRSMEERLMKRLDLIGSAVQGQVSCMDERLGGLEARLSHMETTLSSELPQLRGSIQDARNSQQALGWCASPGALPYPGGGGEDGVKDPPRPQSHPRQPAAFEKDPPQVVGAMESLPLKGHWLESCNTVMHKKSST